MIFSKGERFGLAIMAAVILGYSIMLSIHQSHCFANYRYKLIWIDRNHERQLHGPTDRLDLENGIIPESPRREICCFSDGLANVAFHDEWGFINQQGEWVIKPRFSGTWPFVNGLAGVMQKDKFGFIDKKGRMVIRPRFDNIRNFSGEGLAAVRVRDWWGFIDTTGRFAVQPSYEWADSFSDGLALVKRQGLYGYLNRRGDLVIQPRYQDGRRFREGLAAVRINGKYGFINHQDQTVIAPQYERAADFCQGLAAVKVNGSLGYINRDGKLVIQNRFTSLGNFHNGIAIGRLDGRACLIHQTGRITLTNAYAMQEFSEKYAVIQLKKKYGFCNTQLKTACHFLYREAWPYSEGLAAVRVGSRIEYLRDGAVVIKPRFDWVNPEQY